MLVSSKCSSLDALLLSYDKDNGHFLQFYSAFSFEIYTHVKGTLSRADMRECPIQNLKKLAWCFQIKHSHFQYGVD